MRRVSSADFVRRFSAFCDEALTDPILLTRNGRDRLLVVNVEQYRHLLSLAMITGAEGDREAKIAGELDFLVRQGEAKAASGG